VEPGNITTLQNEPRDLDLEIRIAQIEYRWSDDTTTIKFAENTAGVLDALVRISDEVSRLDARGADLTAEANRSMALKAPTEAAHDLLIERYSLQNTFLFGEPGEELGSPLGASGVSFDGTVEDQ